MSGQTKFFIFGISMIMVMFIVLAFTVKSVSIQILYQQHK